MLFMLLWMIIRQISRPPGLRKTQPLKGSIKSAQLCLVIVGFWFSLTGANLVSAQTRVYQVLRNGDEVGWVNLEKKSDSLQSSISMTSEIKIQFLFTFLIAAREYVEFLRGQLAHSYFYRKRNGTIKADRHTRWLSGGYWVESGGRTSRLSLEPVHFSTLCMYFEEPVFSPRVYSDNCQCFIAIEKRRDGAYRMELPDGGTNDFYYENGICKKVKIDYGYYSVELVKTK